MGYQESLIKTSPKNFDNLVKYLKKEEKRLDMFVDLATVVTFKEEVSTCNGIVFRKDEKAVCITGDRCGQNNGFIFENNQSLYENCHVMFVDYFHYDIEKGYIDNGIPEKLFQTHELASEVPFKDYVKQIQNEKERV